MDTDEGKVPSIFNRKLDVASNASVDMVSLNNVILKMRPKVHATKRAVISKLRDKVKKLRNMKGTEEQKNANAKKALDREKEIAIIKALNNDRVSKFAVGSTEKLETVCSRSGVTFEEIALVRLACHRYIHDAVTEFRKKHSDWKELGAYLMTKHTNRDFKKKKQPDIVTKQVKQAKNMKRKANIEASETMVRSYLTEKLKHKDIGSDSDSEEEEIQTRESVNQSHKKEQERVNEDWESDSSGKEEEEDDDDSGNGTNRESETTDSEKETVEEKNIKRDKRKTAVNNITNDMGNLKNDSKNVKGTEAKGNGETVEKKRSKPKTVEKVEGEIIIKKLNLEEWCNSDQTEKKEKIPKILLADKDCSGEKTKDDKVKSKKKSFDPFFDTGERLFQSRDSKPSELGKNLLAFAGYVNEDNEEEHETLNVDKKDFNDEYKVKSNKLTAEDNDDIFNEKSRRDGSVYIKANSMGKEAFRSTFMESLNSGFIRDRVRKKVKNIPDKEMDRKKQGNFMSAGSKDKLKKKGLFRTRDSKQDELGGNLISIAGYDGDESKRAGNETDMGSGKGFEDGKERKKDFNSYVQAKTSTKKQDKVKSIHPSWEASMKRKQQQSAHVEFTGKKIKFDDDD